MNGVPALQSYLIPAKFEKALKSIRGALSEVEVDIVQEFDLSEDLNSGTRSRITARMLLVSSPILDFEAVALGRAGAVFLPLHLLVTPETGSTRVSLVDPSGLLEGRLPVGIGDPLRRLVGRVAAAFDSLLPPDPQFN